MLITLGGDVEFDILTSQDYSEDQKELRKILQNRTTKDRSLHKTIVQSGQTKTGQGDGTLYNDLILDFGDAPAGALWVPLWITVVGSTDTGTVAGAQVVVYFGGDSGNLSLSNLLIPGSAATAIPYWQALGGKDAVYGHLGDHLAVVIRGAVTVGVTITAIARVREVHPAAVEELNLL